MAFQNGELIYSLYEILIASYTASTDTYGTPISLDADQAFNVEPRFDNDELRDSGGIGELLSVKIGLQVKIQQGGLSLAAVDAMTGSTTVTESGSGSTLIRKHTPRQSGDDLPLFGAIGVGPSANDGSVLVVGLRAVKLNKEPNIMFDGTANKFVIQEGDGQAKHVSGVFDLWRSYATRTLWETNKPTDGSQFKAWFTA